MCLKRQHFLLFFRLYLSFISLLAATDVAAWGPQGHHIAGTLTWQLLSEDARAEVRGLLGEQTLAEASNWADRMRDNPSPFWQRQAGPYHYVTVPPGKTYDEVGAPGKGDAVTALAEFRAILTDPASPRVQKQLALRFSLHIIQDLHQPMHVGNGRDRGGNRVRLTLYGKSTNLHRVWDSAILARAGLGDAEWVERLASLDSAHVEHWRVAGWRVWIEESAALRDRVYPAGNSIGGDYLDSWLPAVQGRLQASAVRGAAWLERVLVATES